MKMINVILLICVSLMITIGMGYLFLDTVFSFGIMSPSIDMRTELIMMEYALLVVLLGLALLKVLIKKKK